MANFKVIVIVAVILFGAGYGAGRYLQPPKEITKIEVQEHEVVKNNIVTVTKEITKADGTKEIVTTVVDKSIEKKDKQIESIVSKPTERQWLVGLGVNPLKYTETYSVKVDRRILGPLFLGGQYIRNKSDNIGLLTATMEF